MSYDVSYKKDYWFKVPVATAVDHLKRWNVIKQGDFCLDIGCGQGQWTQAATKISGNSALGIDFSLVGIKWAKSHFPKSRFEHWDATKFVTDERFSTILMISPSFINVKNALSCKKHLLYTSKFLQPAGRIFWWVGIQQGKDVIKLFETCGFIVEDVVKGNRIIGRHVS